MLVRVFEADDRALLAELRSLKRTVLPPPGGGRALLMLSRPGIDFKGGSLYTVDVDAGCTKRQVHFGRAGDIAVFRSNGSFFHGMDEVRRGDCEDKANGGNEDVTARIAVGLLHRLKS